jgi:hypothetical protein
MEKLPNEILSIIFNFINPFELRFCRSVSKRWKAIIDREKIKQLNSVSIPCNYPNTYTILNDFIYVIDSENKSSLEIRKFDEIEEVYSEVKFPINCSPNKIYMTPNSNYIAVFDDGISLFDLHFNEIKFDQTFYNIRDEDCYLKNSYYDYNTMHLYVIDTNGSVYIWDSNLDIVHGVSSFEPFDTYTIYGMFVNDNKIKLYNNFDNYMEIKLPEFQKIRKTNYFSNSNPGLGKFKNSEGNEYTLKDNLVLNSPMDNYEIISDLGGDLENFAVSKSYAVFIKHDPYPLIKGKRFNSFDFHHVSVMGMKNRTIKLDFKIKAREILNISIFEYSNGDPRIVIQSEDKVKVYGCF